MRNSEDPAKSKYGENIRVQIDIIGHNDETKLHNRNILQFSMCLAHSESLDKCGLWSMKE